MASLLRSLQRCRRRISPLSGSTITTPNICRPTSLKKTSSTQMAPDKVMTSNSRPSAVWALSSAWVMTPCTYPTETWIPSPDSRTSTMLRTVQRPASFNTTIKRSCITVHCACR